MDDDAKAWYKVGQARIIKEMMAASVAELATHAMRIRYWRHNFHL
jgi:hypothetical protein